MGRIYLNNHPTEEQRRAAFFIRIRKQENGCHIWTGGLSSGGYGSTSYQDRMISTHRLAWIFAHGPIPDNKWVLHTCDIRRCVNPGHLYLGDIYQNILDAKSRNRYKRRSNRVTLTAIQAKEIFSRTKSGEKYLSIAKDYGISISTVGYIKRREKWQHVTTE
jgi:hypothetical protein